MNRPQKLFLVLWIIVYTLLLHSFYKFNKTLVTKDRQFSHHVIGFNLGMLKFVENEHEAAAVIAHEYAHLELGHTVMANHNMRREYHSDLLSIYYLTRAGYSVCGAANIWARFSAELVSIEPTTHPLVSSRQHYMTFPQCAGIKLEKKSIGYFDLMEIHHRIAQQVDAKVRFNTIFFLIPNPNINAWATTIFVEVN